jgi:hypothetical protein
LKEEIVSFLDSAHEAAGSLCEVVRGDFSCQFMEEQSHGLPTETILMIHEFVTFWSFLRRTNWGFPSITVFILCFFIIVCGVAVLLFGGKDGFCFVNAIAPGSS